ncbi:Probable calcium-binding protein CML25 [Striga hermonthica]|uniref:Probable calcium-binding protein CML25 n=1 Tax=Striga hermonthica TaxID=68872 RepID=A0A9N7P2K3_STRHE|nr:Probable calcium-binding protein CML25 [Striga hermonthica]
MGLRALFKRNKKKQRQARSLEEESELEQVVNNKFDVNGDGKISELEQVFNKFDVNGDGKISAAELGSIMGSLGHAASEEDLAFMIREVDADGDGFIDLQEFIELNTEGVGLEELLQNLKDAFQVFDIDRNGSISAEELQKVLGSLGEECSIDDCRKMISGVDVDGNGTISFDEFKVMMMKGSRFDAAD